MSDLDDRVIGNKTSPFRILRDSSIIYPRLEDNYVTTFESPKIVKIANYSPMTFKFIMNSNS
jgi:hypothetical protein